MSLSGESFGAISFRISKRFRDEVGCRVVDACESSPGFAKLSTSPTTTGSVPAQKTIGMSCVARFAAMVLLVEVAYIRLTFSCSRFLAASSAAFTSPFQSRIARIKCFPS